MRVPLHIITVGECVGSQHYVRAREREYTLQTTKDHKKSHLNYEHKVGEKAEMPQKSRNQTRSALLLMLVVRIIFALPLRTNLVLVSIKLRGFLFRMHSVQCDVYRIYTADPNGKRR